MRRMGTRANGDAGAVPRRDEFLSDPDNSPAVGSSSEEGGAGEEDSSSAVVVVENPTDHDILLGRGRWYARHAGNQRLQAIINRHLEMYQAAPERKTKTDITHRILDEIKSSTTGVVARFLRRQQTGNHGCWVPVDDDVARLKISQAIRYSIRTPSSSLASCADAQQHETPQEEHKNQEQQPPPLPLVRVSMKRKSSSSGTGSGSSRSLVGNGGAEEEDGRTSNKCKLKRSRSSLSSSSSSGETPQGSGGEEEE